MAKKAQLTAAVRISQFNQVFYGVLKTTFRYTTSISFWYNRYQRGVARNFIPIFSLNGKDILNIFPICIDTIKELSL